MIPIREDLVLPREKRTTRVDQVNTGQVVFFGDLLGTQMLLNCQGIIRAAFYSRVVRDDHALGPMYATNACDDPCAGHVVAVYLPRRLPSDLQEMRALVE